jgi:LysM repeat protein
MNTANPFQIPECLQKADLQQRRRERFKKGVIAIVFAIMALLVVLLIQGCMSERAQITTPTGVGSAPSAPEPVRNLAIGQKPKPQPNLNVTTQASLPVPQKTAPVASLSETFYVVKSGDNLTRIAKLHGITIKAIKAANDLAGDRIVVGAKLKIPQA